MGKLSDFNLKQYIDQYKSSILIETGSGTGTGINFARNFSFTKILSCEIDTDQSYILSERFLFDKRISIFPFESELFLAHVLNLADVKETESIIFFLDAHFPSADLGKKDFDAEEDLDIRLPLERELSIIHRLRKNKKDVIIIDDWRIYEKMDFPGGDLTSIGYGHLTAYNHSNFLDQWSDTHNVEKIKSDTGYILMTPK